MENPGKGPKRRIVNPRITRVSLVNRPANQVELVYKGEDAPMLLEPIVKMDERGEALMLISIPNRPDAHGEVLLPEDVQAAAHSWAKHGMEIDLRHEALAGAPAQSREKIFAAESWLVTKDDRRFDGWKDNKGQPLGDVTGAWAALFKVEDPAIREDLRTGALAGPSMYGWGQRQVIKSEDTMDETKLKALLDAQSASFLTGVERIVKSLTPAPVTPPAPAPEAKDTKPTPVVKSVDLPEGFDANDPEQLQAHKDRIMAATLDLTTFEGIVKWEQYLAGKNAPKPEGKPAVKGTSAQPLGGRVIKDEATMLRERGLACMAQIEGKTPEKRS